MAQVFADRIACVTATTGTGAYTMGAALDNYVAPTGTTGDTMDFTITNDDDFECGTYTKQVGGTWARTTIHSSSNAGAAVSWPAGSKNVIGPLLAARFDATLDRITALEGAPAGEEASEQMRMVQEVVHRAAFTMGNNRANSPESTSGATVAAIGSTTGYATTFAASATEGPWRYYGGDPVLDSWGVRLYSATFSTGNRIGRTAWAEVVVLGDAVILQLEKNVAYRFMVEEGGVDRYLPAEDVALTMSGSGAELYLVEFPSVGRWRLTVEVSTSGSNENEEPGRIGAAYVKATDATLQRPPKKPTKIAFVGSSFIQGVNGPHADSWAAIAAAKLGFKDVLISAVHSTTETISHVGARIWSARRADWIDWEPDFLVLVPQPSVGLDSSKTVQEEIDAIMLEVTEAREALPNCVILCHSHELTDSPSNVDEVVDGVAAEIAALDDTFTRYVDQYASVYEEDASIAGPASWMIQSDHYSALGDRVVGEMAALKYLTEFRAIYYGTDAPAVEPGVALITPTSGNLELIVDEPVDEVLGVISNGTPTGSGITGTAPSGCAFSTSGQNLKITGTPDTPDADISTTITVPTDNGDVVFSLTGTVEEAEEPGGPILSHTYTQLADDATVAIASLGTLLDWVLYLGSTGVSEATFSPGERKSGGTILGDVFVLVGAHPGTELERFTGSGTFTWTGDGTNNASGSTQVGLYYNTNAGGGNNTGGGWGAEITVGTTRLKFKFYTGAYNNISQFDASIEDASSSPTTSNAQACSSVDSFVFGVHEVIVQAGSAGQTLTVGHTIDSVAGMVGDPAGAFADTEIYLITVEAVA